METEPVIVVRRQDPQGNAAQARNEVINSETLPMQEGHRVWCTDYIECEIYNKVRH